MTDAPTVFIATNDLSGLTRGRSVPLAAAEGALRRGVGWVPANLGLTSFGLLAPNPFGSVGDLKLLPDQTTRIVLPTAGSNPAVTMYLADQVLPDGEPWVCCPRSFARNALADLLDLTGLEVIASFEHEFMLDGLQPTAPFSFARHRGAEPFGSTLVQTLGDIGLEPETWLPEYGVDQFEIPLAPSPGLVAADRAVIVKDVVRDLARQNGLRATFAPLVDPLGSGNGVHVHLSLRNASTGKPVLYDPQGPGRLSEVGGQFAAGILTHARALLAFTAPNPTSYLRLTPDRWSAGGVFLAERNREALLRICPTSTLANGDVASQYNLEFRAADATANPWLTLGVLVRAGLSGIKAGSPTPHVWPERIDSPPTGVPALPVDLPQALAALEQNTEVLGWFNPALIATHRAVKLAELQHLADLDVAAQCREVANVH